MSKFTCIVTIKYRWGALPNRDCSNTFCIIRNVPPTKNRIIFLPFGPHMFIENIKERWQQNGTTEFSFDLIGNAGEKKIAINLLAEARKFFDELNEVE